ncbi:piwi domain-containing protein [Phthorimaea operculella]|nr:piwi domain-containing protein [Phthorimaea operculella]
MADRGAGRARGRGGRGKDSVAPPRRPGETLSAAGQAAPARRPGETLSAAGQAAPPGPRPQPPSAWGQPSAAPVRAGVPAPAVQIGGRASHRSTPATHEHPGDVDVQQRMAKLDIGQPAAGTAMGDPGAAVVGRGSRRGGGRVLPEQMTILRTRPATVQSKKATVQSKKGKQSTADQESSPRRYVTILRTRPATVQSKKDKLSTADQESSPRRYVTILRTRPATVQSKKDKLSTADQESSPRRYVTILRTRPDTVQSKKDQESSPRRYVTILRTRPATVQSKKGKLSTAHQESSPRRYVTILRTRPATVQSKKGKLSTADQESSPSRYVTILSTRPATVQSKKATVQSKKGKLSTADQDSSPRRYVTILRTRPDTVQSKKGKQSTADQDSSTRRYVTILRTRPATVQSKKGKQSTADQESSPRRYVTILRTRPATMQSKKGSSGTPLDLCANYFTVETTPQWRLYQYHVDFQPEEDSTGLRKALLRVHANTLGGYLFDGAILYTVKRLHPDPMELYSDRKHDGERMRILIKLTCDVSPGDYHYIQVFNIIIRKCFNLLNLQLVGRDYFDPIAKVFNIIIRKCFNLLNLQLVGRDYFDPIAKVDIPEHKLQIWPGYKTTINQYEDRLLMVTEIAHKVLRMDNVLQMLNEYAATKGSNYKKIFLEDVVGKIVMTDYNKRTYRVDDVHWDSSPRCTFKMKDETISYMDYYAKKYNIRIQDPNQPLLVYRAKAREIRSGMPEMVYLVPELCRQTGLSDEMLANFQLMSALGKHTKIGPDLRIQKLLQFNRRLTQTKEVVQLMSALGKHTKIGPDLRIQKLLQFNRRLTQTKEVVQELASWSLKLSNDLVRFKGRLLPAENIIQANNVKYAARDDYEGWTRDMRSVILLLYSLELVSWLLKLSNDLVRFKGRLLPAENIIQANNVKYAARDDYEGWTRDMRSVNLLLYSLELTSWSLKLSNDLVRFKGRLLPAENIIQANNVKYAARDDYEGWTRDMRSKALLTIAPVGSWVVITPERQRRDAEGFVDLIMKTGSGVGFRMPRPEICPIARDGHMDYANMCENVIARKNPSFILCVLARKGTDRYEAIKKKCTVDRAMPTQCVVARNMTAKSAMSIATKIAIQINCKLGGAPWSVEVPLSTLMVIGYDVCHDTRLKDKSFGAFVATLDRQMTHYYSTVNAHTSGEELSAHMGINIATAVRKYRERNNVLPGRIFIYRDGVGDGQIPYVHSHEVEEIKKQLESLYQGEPVKMAFIIVSKRINTRIFVDRGRSGDNPRPGTVIDDVVTLPERYDFYLVSQNVREGTIAPTSYNVIYDTTSLDPDRIQRLTYKLTHMYFNNSSAVRVPSVCQYAHKLAFLAANSLHSQPHYTLNETLYFL